MINQQRWISTAMSLVQRAIEEFEAAGEPATAEHLRVLASLLDAEGAGTPAEISKRVALDLMSLALGLLEAVGKGDLGSLQLAIDRTRGEDAVRTSEEFAQLAGASHDFADSSKMN